MHQLSCDNRFGPLGLLLVVPVALTVALIFDCLELFTAVMRRIGSFAPANLLIAFMSTIPVAVLKGLVLTTPS